MSAIDTFLATATAAIGKPYVFGAEGPSTFDCSGLVQYALSLAGIKSPRLAHDQEAWATPVSNPQPGDLAFWGYGSNAHVAIYIGGGKVINAAEPGTNVRIQSVWKGGAGQPGPRYGRVPGLGAATAGIVNGITGAVGNATSGISASLVGPILDGAKNIVLPAGFALIGLALLGGGLVLIMAPHVQKKFSEAAEVLE
jgi:hypothetical protein